jgi:cell division protein ZipA
MIDLDLRDWLLILGPLVIAGVLAHGYWKMRRGTPRLRMALEKKFQNTRGEAEDTDDLSSLRGELPSGGARIVKQDLNDRNKGDSDRVADINLEEDVPVLMDPVQIDEDTDEGTVDQLEFDSLIPDELLTGPTASREKKQSPKKRKAKKPSRPEKLFVMSVLSKKDDFNGQYLLESLVTCGFRFGDMNIFHYMDDKTGESIFSLVNAVEPGTFDPNTMDQLATPGVSLFIKLHELDDPVAGFEQMIEAVEQLSVELDAEIKDGKHNLITQQALEHEMQLIREYSVKYPS